MCDQKMESEKTQTKKKEPPVKLFISNISKNTTTNDLTSHFSQFGKVLSCNLSNVSKRKNRTFILIELAHKTTFDSITSIDHFINGKRIKVTNFMDKKWFPNKRKIYVYGIPGHFRDGDLYHAFHQYGEIEKYQIKKEEMLEKNYGVIVFSNQSFEEKLPKNGFIEYGGNRLRFCKTSPKDREKRKKKKRKGKERTRLWKKIIWVE